MQAVIETGGKQYRVTPGDVIDVELVGDAEQGSEITFDTVLLVRDDNGVKAGADVAGATVRGVLVDESRGPKVRVFKFKRRKGYRRTNGHRQTYHRVRIEGVEL